MANKSPLRFPLSSITTTSLLFVLLLSNYPDPCQARALTRTEGQKLDRFVRDVMGCANIPSLTLSLVGDGGVAYERAYDDTTKRMPSGPRATTVDTVFCLGGSTQAFTSVLLSMLLSYKNQSFSSPISDITQSRYYLPGRFRTEMVNLKDVLGMRTGLSNMDIVATAMGMNRYRLMQNLRFAPDVSDFREDNTYSEVLYSLAEDAARALGDDSWYNLMRRYIFNPLGMSNAGFVHMDVEEKANVARPVHTYSNQFIPVPWDTYKGQEVVAAASSVCASASDMSKWMYFILNGGNTLENNQVANEDTIKSTFKSVQTRSNGGDTRTSGFSQSTIQVAYSRESNALGWIKGQYRGYPFVSQDGSLPGYESLTTLLPSRGVGVFTAFVGNGGAKAYAAKVLINMYAIDLLLKGQPWLDQSSVCDTLVKMSALTASERSTYGPSYLRRVDEPARPMEEYEGTYRNYAFGDVTVRRNESGFLRLEYGDFGQYLLYPTQVNDTFILHADKGVLWYTTNADEYRKRAPFVASFGNHWNDPSLRIETVMIPHFDRQTDPVFSKNPPPPRRYEDEYAERCDGSASMAACVGLVVTSFVLSVSGLVR